MSKLDPRLESELIALIQTDDRENLPIIKRLCDVTGGSIQEAIRWIADHEPVEHMPCPYCGKTLRTKEARQCFECGTDWHDPEFLVRHIVRRDRQKIESAQPMIEIDDWPIYVVNVTNVGPQPSKVFILLRRMLQVDPATAKAMLSSARIEVARGERMFVEPIFNQFRSAGAEVEMTVDESA